MSKISSLYFYNTIQPQSKRQKRMSKIGKAFLCYLCLTMITKYFSLCYRITIVQINLAHSSIFFLFTVIIASDLFIILLYLIHDFNKQFIVTFTHLNHNALSNINSPLNKDTYQHKQIEENPLNTCTCIYTII